MRNDRSYLFLPVLLTVLLACAGCVPLLIGAAAGAGGMTYVKGVLKQNVDHDLETVHKATLKALKNLKMFISSDELNKRDAVVKAEFDDGKEAKIFLDAITEHATKISVRVGFFGDQGASQVIMSAILKEL